MLGLEHSLANFEFTPVAALTVFAASIAGSVHCVGMCGGLMLAATGTKLRSLFAYHLARWIAYLSVGSIAGYLGNELFYDWRWLPFQIFFSTVFLLLLLTVGLSYFFGWGKLKDLKLTNASMRISRFGINLGLKMGRADGSIARAAMIGFFTVFLPCGWLYSFILLALATHSVLYGGLTLTIFWLGTVPALMGSRIFIQGLMAKLGVNGTRVISVMMIFVAFFSVYEHWKSISLKAIQGGTTEVSTRLNCHEEGGGK